MMLCTRILEVCLVGVRGAVMMPGEKLFELRSAAAAGVVGMAVDRGGFRD